MSDTDAEQFSLRWNNFHSNLSSGFHALLQGEDLVDVTLAAGGNFVQAHKIVLSVCSPYFKELFKVNPCKHPIVIMKDVGHKELISILEFMYLGEVNVRQEELSSFLKTAETLQVKGLTGDDSPAPLASHPQRKQTVTRKHSSVLEPLVVHSEESPTRPIKRARVGAPPPTSSPFTSSPHNSPALRLMPSSPACSENLRDNEVVLTKPKQEPIKEVGLTRPKQEPIEYDSDIEEVTLDEKMLRGHDPLMNVSLDQTLQRGDEHPLMSLLGGGSSQQQDPMAALPLFGISHDSGGSQDSGQVSDGIGNTDKPFYTKTVKGNLKLVLGGYFYTKHRERRDEIVWRCENRALCSGMVWIQDGADHVKKQIAHTHEPNWKKFLDKLRWEQLNSTII